MAIAVRDARLFGIVAATAAMAGALVVYRPAFGIALGIGAPLLVLLVAESRARLAAVVVGALLAFASSSSEPKYVYLAVTALCFGVSAAQLARRGDAVSRAFRPLLGAGSAVVVVLLMSGFVAHANGLGLKHWAQDILSYVLLVALPVVGLDAAKDLPTHVSSRLIGVLGIVAAAAFALHWLDSRGVSRLGAGGLVLATDTLAMLGFAHAVVQTTTHSRAVVWGLVALFIATALLVNGTRTNILMMVAFLGALGTTRKARAPIGRILGTMAAVGAAAICLVPLVADYVVRDPNFLAKRVAALTSVLAGTDQSYLSRLQSYDMAHNRFQEHPWFGGGPGYEYRPGFISLDTPWILPAKFGVIGSVVFVAFFAAIVVSVRNTRLIAGYQSIHTTARAWVFVLIAFTPFFPWWEDKGTALGLAVVLAAMARAASDKESPPPRAPDCAPLTQPMLDLVRQPPLAQPQPGYESG